MKDLENREIILRIPLFCRNPENKSDKPDKSKLSLVDKTKMSMCLEDDEYISEDSDSQTTTQQTQQTQSNQINNINKLPGQSSDDAKNAFTYENELTLTEGDGDYNGISDNDNDSTGDDNGLNNTEDDNSIDVNELIEELKKKDRVIKQLKSELIEIKNYIPTTCSIGKDVKIIPMSVGFIDNKTGKPLICEKTTISCWWCTYQFDTLPCFIPERYNDNKFYVFGCFCSFDCATAYNIGLNDYKVFDRNSLIKKLYNLITGKTDDIPIAPPREILNKYGGLVTIEEYRKGDRSISKEYRLLLPPMVNLISCIEEKTKDRLMGNVSKQIVPEVKRVTIDENHIIPVKKKTFGDSSINIMDSVGIKEVKRKSRNKMIA